MAITTIVMDVYKPGSELKNKVVDISDSFNARVGDDQVRLVVKYIERGIVERMEQEQLTPFMMGFVGQPDEEQKVTAETGIAVSYHGSTNDIIGGGKVKMDLPGNMFPQEGAFYGFFGLENSDGKRVTTNNVFFRVENDNPDMYVDAVPFRTELQKLLDEAVSKSNSTVGEIQKSWETLKGTITTLLETGNSNLDAYLSRLKLAENELGQYEKDLTAGKGISQADLDSALTNLRESIKEGLEELNNQIVVDDNIEISKDVTAENKNAIVNIVSQLNPNNFNIGYITDNHSGLCSWNTDYSEQFAYEHLSNFLQLDGHVDAMLAGGDNADCWRPSDQSIVVDNRRFITQFLYSTDNLSDKFILKGNHDDGSIRTNDYRRGVRKFDSIPKVIKDSEFNKMIAADQLLFDEHRNNGRSYFYKDYPDKKVRLIGLNSNDTPDDILLNDGSPKYLGGWDMGYRQEQLNWLANVALQNVPENYVTIIFSHIQANIPGYEGDPNHDRHYNQNILIKIIKDFMTGSSSSLSSDLEDYKINITTNFTIQGKRDFAGYIHGHEHTESVSTDLGFNNIGFFASYNIKGLNEGNSDAWQTISIDKKNRKLIIKGFGRSTNRIFDY